MKTPNRYSRRVWYWDEAGRRHPVPIDVYDVLTAYEVSCPAIGHAVKKLLCPGQRGHKDRLTDLKEAAVSIERAIQLAAEAEGASVAAVGDPLDIPAPVPCEHREPCGICSNPRCDTPNGKH